MMRRRKTDRQHTSLLGRNFRLILIFVIVLSAITLLSYYYMDDIYLFKAKYDMQTVAEKVAEMDLADEKTNAALSDLEASNNFYFEIYDKSDRLVYTTDTNNSIFETTPQEDKSQKLKPRIMRIVDRTEIDDVSYFEIRQEFFATAKYVVYGTTFDSGISTEIYASMELINANAQTTFRIILYIVLLLMLLILMLFSIQTFGFTIPISTINRITKRLAKMDFDMVCPPFRLREMDELSTNINRLSASLDLTLKTLRRRNAQLEQDIENEKKLLESRKQFIANASHELKTPIAIIQGYAEGLKYGIYDNNRDACYDVILDEAQKMNSLVLHLMELSKLNATTVEPDYTVFSLQERIHAFLQSLETVFVKNGISVKEDIDPAFIASADQTLFERVMSNYVSNAVSHCAGKKEICVSCKSVDGCYRISVFNTGEPIADEDLPNIWNSFYRADKAHSRSEGRFGLGLPIVVSAQEAQHMLYGVINHEDGVEFWFDVRAGVWQ